MGLFSFLRTTNYCCYCIPLRIGIIILGIFYMLYGIGNLSRAYVDSIKVDECYLKHKDKFEPIHTILFSLMGFSQFFAGLCMIVMIITALPILVDIIIFLLLLGILMSVVFVVVWSVLIGCSDWYKGDAGPVNALVFALFTVYFIIVVRSYGEEIDYD